MSQMLALVIVVAILYIGDVVSVRTKAWIPSVFVCCRPFLTRLLDIFPARYRFACRHTTCRRFDDDLFTHYEYGHIAVPSTTKRTMENHFNFPCWNFRDCRGSYSESGSLLIRFETVIVAIPPLVGGVVSALIMSEGAANAGLATLSVFAIVIYVMQGFAGYPLTSIVLKKEGKMTS